MFVIPLSRSITAGDPTAPFQVTVNDITDSLVSGTFKGKMYLNNPDTTPAGVAVTEGEFKLKIRQ